MTVSTGRLLAYIAVMAGVTYLIRMLPITLIKGKINNRFIKSFLYYVPFAVLSAMIIPDILFSTASVWSAAAGLLVAVIMSLLGANLLPVAAAACGVVYIAELIMRSIG